MPAEILVCPRSPYTVLQKSGIPLPVCLYMQGKGLQLEDAQWTALRQSNGGFSVTFFWPALRLMSRPLCQWLGRKGRGEGETWLRLNLIDNTFDMQHSSVASYYSSTSSSGGNRAQHNGFPNGISSVDGHTGNTLMNTVLHHPTAGDI